MSVGIRQLETDVLILGGGLAALRAAIAAASAGARVAVMTKGTAGRAGSSAITSAGFSVAIGQTDPADSPQSHFADTIRGGGVNRRRLVEIFCEEAPARFWEMVSWGVQFERDAGTGRILQHPSGDHSHPRTAVCVQHKGIGMTLPLRAAAAGVEFLDRIIALDLMHDENGVSGVVALDQQTLELLAVRAGTTILATGGIGQLYPVTSNPNDVTGDGLALAYRAGARLVDMEFMQFYPWRLISYVTGRMPVQPSSFVVGAVLRNAAASGSCRGMTPNGATPRRGTSRPGPSTPRSWKAGACRAACGSTCRRPRWRSSSGSTRGSDGTSPITASTWPRPN